MCSRAACGCGLDEPLGGAGLQRDDRDRVRDDVVQLARDPRALGRDRLARPLAARLLGRAHLRRAASDQVAGASRRR